MQINVYNKNAQQQSVCEKVRISINDPFVDVSLRLSAKNKKNPFGVDEHSLLHRKAEQESERERERPQFYSYTST